MNYKTFKYEKNISIKSYFSSSWNFQLSVLSVLTPLRLFSSFKSALTLSTPLIQLWCARSKWNMDLIFVLKMMMKSGLEKNHFEIPPCTKPFLENLFYFICIRGDFCIKLQNDLLCPWRDFNKTFCGIST